MDTKALEKFCPWARVRLIDAVDMRCRLYGLDDAGRAAAPAGSDVVAGRVLAAAEKAQRDALIARIEAHGYDALVQEAAFTWFNRYIAIRYMELHGYLSSNVRMLSCAADGSFAPDCLRQAADLALPGLDEAEVLRLLGESDDEAVFRLVLVAQCNELALALPNIFGHVGEADALLLPGNLLGQGADDVLYHLVADIPEETWADPEVLGWMYQFYNAELKADFFNSKRKAAAADIAPATQLFTPKWIVRYMVENSLGRLWMLNHPESALRERMEYYIEPDAEHEDFLRISSPEDITFCDPACGSGHILSYAFELLFAMYEESGYREREIPELILTKNIAGMEIDERAAQIASLVLALRAREHDRRFFRRDVHADVTVLESIPFENDELIYCGKQLAEALTHLGEVGSLLAPSDGDLESLRADLAACKGDLFANAKAQKLELAIQKCESLARRFDVVVANPPYMGSSKFNPFMSAWVKKHYPDVKSDLFSAFIVRIMGIAKEHGECGIMCPFVWMFIGSYEKLRQQMIGERTLTSLIQLEYSGFAGATVPICTFTFHNSHIDGYEGGYVRLSDFVGPENQAPKALEAIQNPACGWFYRRDAQTFTQIPGTPIAYWATEKMMEAFGSNKSIREYAWGCNGMTTGENDRFLRLWHEVDRRTINAHVRSAEEANKSQAKWFPYNKGGDFRKWYGNEEWVINWENDGFDAKAYGHLVPRSQKYMFQPQITWSKISSGNAAFRFKEEGHMFDVAGLCLFPNSPTDRLALMAFCNSCVAGEFLAFLCPTLNFEVGGVTSMPLNKSLLADQGISELSSGCVGLSKTDWDSLETSWDFRRSPLL